MKKEKSKSKLDLGLTLILYALIPLITVSVVLSTVIVTKSTREMKGWTNTSLLQVVKSTGNAFDMATITNEKILKAYSTAPIVKEVILHQDDPEIAAAAEQY